MATEKLTEQEIQLRKRARRRLVGAIALVLLMVTVLPMVLDDREVQVPQPEIAINIPSQDGTDFASRIVPVAPSVEPVVEPAKPVEPVPVAKPEATPSQNAAAAQPVEVAKPAAPQKSVVAVTGHAVQIGVYSDAGNVKRIQEKLASMGYQSYTEKMDTQKGSMIRLRVGPFVERAEADKAMAVLKTAGLPGIVVSK